VLEIAMRENEARGEVLKRLAVGRQLVTLAKAFLLFHSRPDKFHPEELIDEFAKQQGHEKVQHVVLHETVDPEPHLAQTVGYLSSTVAFVQAFWNLVHSGYYMAYGALRVIEPHQGWTTVIPGTGGHTGGWTFPELSYVLPEYAIRSPYWRLEKPEPVTDPDLFILEAGVEGADLEVVEALQDAVRCLRNELYRPAVTLLGKAMEGAWVELGIALAGALPGTAKSQGEKVVERLKDENRGIARKINDVRTLYERRGLLEPVIKAAAVRPEELESVVIWSDVVREARNAIHFGAKPAVANSYEKVVVLFLEAAKGLGMMYRIKQAAEQRR
jgi:hypothetical protein